MSGDNDFVSNNLAKDCYCYNNIRSGTHIMCEAWMAWRVLGDNYVITNRRAEDSLSRASANGDYNEAIGEGSCPENANYEEDVGMKDTRNSKNLVFVDIVHNDLYVA